MRDTLPDTMNRGQFKADVDNYPILVSMNVAHLIRKRALVCGLTLFLRGFNAPDEPVTQAMALTATVIAIIAVALVVRTEVRAKIS